jgi:hypothetical protein
MEMKWVGPFCGEKWTAKKKKIALYDFQLLATSSEVYQLSIRLVLPWDCVMIDFRLAGSTLSKLTNTFV